MSAAEKIQHETVASFPPGAITAQADSAALVAKANSLTANTARAILESQAQLWRLNAEHLIRVMEPPVGDLAPLAAMSAYADRWRDSSERLVTELRRTNDVLRNYGWNLLAICAGRAN